MEQLVMRWEKKKTPECPDAPDWGEFTCRPFDGSDRDIDMWLEIVKCGLTGEKLGPDFYRTCMYEHGDPEFDKFFIVEKDGDPVATLAVIPHYDKKEGYIHMVACRDEYRGQGVGTRLNVEALRALHRAGLETAYLTTDDFRIPAIRSYLRAGFYPDIIDEEHRARWDAIFEIINSDKRV